MKYSTLKTGAAALFTAALLMSSNLAAAQTHPSPAPTTTPAAPADSMKDHTMAPGGMEGHDMMKPGMEMGKMGMGMKCADMAPDAAMKPCCGKMGSMKKDGTAACVASKKPHAAHAKPAPPKAKTTPATPKPMPMPMKDDM